MADTGRTTRVGARVSPSLRGHSRLCVWRRRTDGSTHGRIPPGSNLRPRLARLTSRKVASRMNISGKNWLPRLRFRQSRNDTSLVRSISLSRLFPLPSPPPSESILSSNQTFRACFRTTRLPSSFFPHSQRGWRRRRNASETSSVVRLQGFPPTGFTHLGRNFQAGLASCAIN